MKAALTQYDSVDAVMPFLLKVLAAEKLGQSELLLDKFCEGFSVEEAGRVAFRAKVKRYLDMFREVLST
jgi:hypothetical protein